MDLLAFILAISAEGITDEQVQTALNAYIAEHPEAITTVTDGSITKAKLDSNLQATVDDVGVLKSALTQDIQNVVGANSFITGWIDGKCFNTSTKTISTSAPTLTDAEKQCVIISCSANDVFVVNSTILDHYKRAWAFVDSSGNTLQNANAQTKSIMERIVAPTNSAYLIINRAVGDADSYKGESERYQIEVNKKRIDELGNFVATMSEAQRAERNKNIFNGKVFPGLLQNTGITTTDIRDGASRYFVTDFLDVVPGKYYFTRSSNGSRTLQNISFICTYDAAKGLKRYITSKTDVTIETGEVYLRLGVGIPHDAFFQQDFMVAQGNSNNDPYMPYKNQDEIYGQIYNMNYFRESGTTDSGLHWDIDSDYTSGDYCFVYVEVYYENAVTNILVQIGDSTLEITDVQTGEWIPVAISGNANTFRLITAFSGSTGMQWRNFVGFNQTKYFGSGNEMPGDAIADMLDSKCFGKPYFSLATSKMLAAIKRQIYAIAPSRQSRVFCSDTGNVEISSAPNSSWAGWSEIGTYGQMNIASIPIYNKVHGTIETDGMFSAIPLWGAWSQNAAGSNTHHGGHVFHGWTTDRTNRLTMTQNIYRDDEAAVFNYLPGDRSHTNEGVFLRLRLGADNNKKGVLIDNIYNPENSASYWYCRMSVNGILNIDPQPIGQSAIPSAPDSDGKKGDFVFDANYIYICTDTNTWKRVPLETWTT